VTLGHESADRRARGRRGAAAVKPGDFVTRDARQLRACHQCRLGRRTFVRTAHHRIDQDGAFAEFVKFGIDIWKLDAAIPEHYGAILDPLGKRCTPCWRADRGADGFWLRGAGDWADVHCGSEGVRKLDGCLHGNERAAARDGEENGRGTCAESAKEDAVGKILAETSGTGRGCPAGNEREFDGIQQGFKALRAGGRASLLDSDRDCAAGFLVNDVISRRDGCRGFYGGECMRLGCR